MRREPIYVLPPFKERPVLVPLTQQAGYQINLLGIQDIWKTTSGEGVKVAVLDTGIVPHPDLDGAILDAIDFSNSRYGVADLQGHGTFCAGEIAARDNTIGVVGVAHKSKVLVGKVLGDNGSGASTTVARGIRWAIDKGADIISMSLGSPQPDPQLEAAIRDAIAANVIVVAAAGNDGKKPFDTVNYPARYPGVISVGAIDKNQKVTDFSARGKRVDIMAPGKDITGCWPPRGYSTLSGTSMAAPLVAAIIALLLAKYRMHGGDIPPITPDQVLMNLRQNAVDLGDPGFDTDYGFGMIDPDKLMLLANPPPPPPPVGGVLNSLDLGPDDLTESGKAKVRQFLGKDTAAQISFQL